METPQSPAELATPEGKSHENIFDFFSGSPISAGGKVFKFFSKPNASLNDLAHS
jgi:hypothetical protein